MTHGSRVRSWDNMTHSVLVLSYTVCAIAGFLLVRITIILINVKRENEFANVRAMVKRI